MVLHPAGRDADKQEGGGAEEPGPWAGAEGARGADGIGGEASSGGIKEDQIHLNV